ncbi:MAG: hypothetical protein JXA33_16210 [Anaerolineae bacterium]|nr:hypothetical protein [Anaerolineae bacterium]
MATLTLTSNRQHPLRPLVEAALENQLRLLQAGIAQTQERLHKFEAEYALSSTEFIYQYENDNLPETLAFDEWVGEYRMLTRLREKAETLQDIRYAD